MGSEQPTILVADDDELDSKLTERALARVMPGANIVSCRDGQQALEQLERLAAADGERPRMVLMDFKMPRMGCLDVLRHFEHKEVMQEVPIILFSSSVSPTDVQNCIREGVREYVEKPTDPDQYDRAVEDICMRYAKATVL